jgi:lambda repressor-like predicted transcriptional regulator
VKRSVLTIADLRRRGVRVDALLERLGVPAARLEQWLAGRAPAAWIQREIAAAVGVERHELWPDEGDP